MVYADEDRRKLIHDEDWNNIDVEEYCNVVTNRDTVILLFDSNLWKDLQFIARCNCYKTYME